jgi:hypothetical protein
MGTKLTGQGLKPTPVVSVTQKEGGKFVGKLLAGAREVKLRRGKGYVYEFALSDTDMPIQIKDENGNYADVSEIAEGDKVSIFAPTVLRSALDKAAVGNVIQIIYLGKESGDKGEYHNFDVELV